MIKGFNIEDYKDSSLLRFLIQEVVSVKFSNYSKEEKINLINNLDNFITDNSDIDSAIIVLKDNYDNDILDEVCIGNIDNCKSGFHVLYKYFFQKRLQYQKQCIVNNDKGIYSEAEFESINDCYCTTPVSKKRLYIPYSKSSKKYLYNYNVSDAAIYACDACASAIEMINYDYLYQDYNVYESIKFLYTFKKSIDFYNSTCDKLKKQFTSEKKYRKIKKNIHEMHKQVDIEYKYLDLINSILSLEDDELKEACVFSCFDSNVWENLDLGMKKIVVELANDFISKKLQVDKKHFRENEANEDVISIDNLEKANSYDILESLIYTYLHFKCTNGSLNDNCDKTRSNIEKLAFKLKKDIYNNVKGNFILKEFKIDYYNNNRQFFRR